MDKTFLLVHQGALGDLVLCFPALIALKKYVQSIHLLCQNRLGKLSCHLGLTDRHFPIESALFASLYADSPASEVREMLMQYDAIVLFSFSQQLCQTIRRITEKDVYLIAPRPALGQKIHVSRHILSGLADCGLLKSDDISPIIQDFRYKNADPAKILIHPGSGSPRKNWHVSNFIRVYELLEAEGKKPEFVLGPAEESLAEDLKNIGIIHQHSDLPELADLLRHTGGFIGNDSGATHLAAFLGLTVTAIFGPSDPERWKPLGRAVRVLRAKTSCSPCFEISTKNCDKPECFESADFFINP
jgi:ADP-heptose:LPS heptosyltransferase